jgi:hypothetical protein
MRRGVLCLVFALLFPGFQEDASAQEVILPAGTLLLCTLSEPNFSSATAEVGDPVICHASALQQFGRVVSPRGAYLAGRFTAYRDPGHFLGKGWLKLEFDRIVLPNTTLPVPGKLIAVRGYRLDREGRILGRGHLKRDAIEWMFPPLWPWKLLALPARGPRPTLKGEVGITLRLMDDVAVPLVAAASRPAVWKPSAQSPARLISGLPGIRYLPPTIPAMQDEPGVPSAAAPEPSPGAESGSASERRSAQLTLLALKTETIYAVTNYWLEGDRLFYVLPSGGEGAFDLSEVDWGRTTQLNAERGVTITLRPAPRAY